MRLCRFERERIGIVQGDMICDVTGLVGRHDNHPNAPGAWIDTMRKLAAIPLPDLEKQPYVPLVSVRLECPVGRPGKIIGAPLNYADHVEEMRSSDVAASQSRWSIEEAGLFLKAPSSLIGPAQSICLPFSERRTDHEVELVVVIGTRASNVPESAALEHVLGYCLGLDITLRGPEDRSLRKSIDGFSVLGPWLVTRDEVPDPQDIALTLHVGSHRRQSGHTADMVWSVARLIAYASRFYTLEPGDIIFTGTPAGVGPIADGDVIRAEGTFLGSMDISVHAKQPSAMSAQ